MTQIKSKYQPLPGFIICKPLNEELLAGGFKAPESLSEKDSAGIVVAVGDPWIFREGDKEYTITPKVKVGDKIIFKNLGHQRYSDSETGEPVYLLKYHDDIVYTDVMAIIK